jgi:hypothetical protein
VFVFEGFGAAHRPHASIVGCAVPPHAIPVRVSGLLVEKEISIFADVLSTPRRPFLAIVGGSKVLRAASARVRRPSGRFSRARRAHAWRVFCCGWSEGGSSRRERSVTVRTRLCSRGRRRLAARLAR